MYNFVPLIDILYNVAIEQMAYVLSSSNDNATLCLLTSRRKYLPIPCRDNHVEMGLLDFSVSV